MYVRLCVCALYNKMPVLALSCVSFLAVNLVICKVSLLHLHSDSN